MPVYLSPNAVEQSTYAITVAFTDEAGNPVTPNAGATWTLTDSNGNVINELEDVGFTEDDTITIVLSGADLTLVDNDKERVLTVQCTYDSDLGNDLSFKQEVRFFIDDLVNVS